MISKISSLENRKVNTPIKESAKKGDTSFKGVGDFLLKGIQMCEEMPMLNVSVLDLSTAIIPRTIIETKESNAYAGMEAFRRESSGLIVNCLLPSFIVMGTAGILQKFGVFKNLKGMTDVWANEESLNIIKDYFLKAEGTGSDKFENALKSFVKDLSGVDGNSRKAFKDCNIDSSIKYVAISPLFEKGKKLFDKGYQEIASKTHITEHLELGDKVLSKNLKGYLEDFVKVYKAAKKNGVKSSEDFIKFINKSVKLVNAKSFAGLALILPLAISMQPLNRWLTAKHSGVKGAPIYKDFAKTDKSHSLSKDEKLALLKQKFISVDSMLGVMFMSMGLKLPNKQMLQSKGIFPTMEQARFISTATFASRMLSSEDKNELREATIRDIATFSSLYFLGDYAAKGVATLIEKLKPDVKLLNYVKQTPKDASAYKKFTNWLKNVNLKSSDEVVDKIAKNYRSVCQLGNLAFSLLALGIFIPLYTRTQTNKKREAELKDSTLQSKNSNAEYLNLQMKNSVPTFNSFFSLQ